MKTIISSLFSGVVLSALIVTGVLASKTTLALDQIGVASIHEVEVDSGRNSQANYRIEIADPTMHIEDGRVYVQLGAVIPNFEEETNELADTKNFGLNPHMKYRYSTLKHARVHEEHTSELEVRVAVRWKERFFNIKHTTHLNIDVETEVVSHGTAIRMHLDLQPKRGFSGRAEGAIQRELSKYSGTWELSPVFMGLGVRIENFEFAGTISEDNLGVNIAVSVPLSVLPKLMTGGLPDLTTALVKRPDRQVATYIQEHPDAAGGYWGPVSNLAGRSDGPMIWHEPN